MYEIWMTDSAQQDYNMLDLKIRHRVNVVLMQLKKGEFHHKNISTLQGKFKGNFRYRLGQWHIIFSIDYQNKIVIVSTIMPRGDIYKK